MVSKEEQCQKNTEALRQTLRDNPELVRAFKETLDELSKPENVKKMADDILSVMRAFNIIRQGGDINEIK